MATEQVNIDLIISSAESAKTLGEVKNSIRDINKALLDTKTGTAEFNRLQDALTGAREKVRNTKKEFDILNQTVGFAKNLAAGFGIATSAIGLFTDGNKEMEKSLLKVQSALTLVTSITAFADGLKKAKEASDLLKLSLLSNPIFIIATALAAATAAFILFNNSAEDATKQNEELNKTLGTQTEELAKLEIEYELASGKINEYTKSLKLLELEREKQLKQIKSDAEKQALEASDSFFNKLIGYFNPSVAAGLKVKAFVKEYEKQLKANAGNIENVNKIINEKIAIANAENTKKTIEENKRIAEENKKFYEEIANRLKTIDKEGREGLINFIKESIRLNETFINNDINVVLSEREEKLKNISTINRSNYEIGQEQIKIYEEEIKYLNAYNTILKSNLNIIIDTEENRKRFGDDLVNNLKEYVKSNLDLEDIQEKINIAENEKNNKNRQYYNDIEKLNKQLIIIETSLQQAKAGGYKEDIDNYQKQKKETLDLINSKKEEKEITSEKYDLELLVLNTLDKSKNKNEELVKQEKEKIELIKKQYEERIIDFSAQKKNIELQIRAKIDQLKITSQLEIDAIEKRRDELLKNEKLTEAQRIQIIKDAENQINVITAQEGKTRLQLKIQLIKLEREELLQNTKLTELERQNIINESELKIKEARIESFNSTLNDINFYITQIGSFVSKTGDLINADIEEQSRQRIELWQAEANAANDILAERLKQDAITQKEYDTQKEANDRNLRRRIAKEEKKQFQAKKAASIANAVISTALSVVNMLAQAPWPSNFVFAALAGALGAAEIAIIAKEKPPQELAKGGVFEAAGGGVVRGPGSGTSDDVNAKLSNGESVINARSTNMFAPLLSAINEIGGGVAFNNQRSIVNDNNSVPANKNENTTNLAVSVSISEEEVSRVQNKAIKIKNRAEL